MFVIGLVDRALGTIDIVVRWIAGGALLVMTFVLFGNSMIRFLFGISFVGGAELGRLMVIWLTFLGAYLVVRKNAHVAIDILLRVVPDRVYRWLQIAVGLIGCASMGYVGWIGQDLAEVVYASGQMSGTLPVLRVVFYLPVPLGGYLMAIGFLHLTAKAVFEGVERPDETADALEPRAR